MHQVTGERCFLSIDLRNQRHRAKSVAGCRQDEDVAVVPAKSAIVAQDRCNWNVLGEGIEIVAYIVKVNHRLRQKFSASANKCSSCAGTTIGMERSTAR